MTEQTAVIIEPIVDPPSEDGGDSGPDCEPYFDGGSSMDSGPIDWTPMLEELNRRQKKRRLNRFFDETERKNKEETQQAYRGTENEWEEADKVCPHFMEEHEDATCNEARGSCWFGATLSTSKGLDKSETERKDIIRRLKSVRNTVGDFAYYEQHKSGKNHAHVVKNVSTRTWTNKYMEDALWGIFNPKPGKNGKAIYRIRVWKKALGYAAKEAQGPDDPNIIINDFGWDKVYECILYRQKQLERTGWKKEQEEIERKMPMTFKGFINHAIELVNQAGVTISGTMVENRKYYWKWSIPDSERPVSTDDFLRWLLESFPELKNDLPAFIPQLDRFLYSIYPKFYFQTKLISGTTQQKKFV